MMIQPAESMFRSSEIIDNDPRSTFAPTAARMSAMRSCVSGRSFDALRSRTCLLRCQRAWIDVNDKNLLRIAKEDGDARIRWNQRPMICT